MRRRNSFAVLDNDGNLLEAQLSGGVRVDASYNQPAVMEGTSTPDSVPDLPDQDDPPVVASSINHAHLTTSAIGLIGTHWPAN